MAILFSGDENCNSYADDDYRAYLISRNPPPIVHHSASVQFKRLQVHARRMVSAVDFVLHWMTEALSRHRQK